MKCTIFGQLLVAGDTSSFTLKSAENAKRRDDLQSSLSQRRRTQSLSILISEISKINSPDRVNIHMQSPGNALVRKPLQMIPVRSAQKLQRTMQFRVEILREHSMESTHVPILEARRICSTRAQLVVLGMSNCCLHQAGVQKPQVILKTSITGISCLLMKIFDLHAVFTY